MLNRLTLSLLRDFPLFSRWRMYTSLMMEEEEVSSRDETVEMVAAIGPMITTPAQKGLMTLIMVRGIMLSTLLP